MTAALEQARAIADAVLYEGYLLYPYRGSAVKNQARWQFGVLVPPSYAAEDNGEHTAAVTECLAEADSDAVLHLRVRFLQVQARTVESDTGNGFAEVASLTVDGRELRAWDEAVERSADAVLPVRELLTAARTIPITVPGGEDVEPVPGGRVIRRRWPVHGELRCAATELPGPYGVLRVRATVANVSTVDLAGVDRATALRHSLIAAHTMLAWTGGQFLSLLEPPEWAAGYVRDCVNEHTWPVLVGEPGHRDTVLSSPIILYDHPAIAPESAGSFCDATEIDELLALRTLTLTEDEKREARATDPRAADIVDLADELPPELLERLHGTIRFLRPAPETPHEPDPAEEVTAPPATPWWEPGADSSVSPETDRITVDGRSIGKGSRVVLRPGLRRADAQDMFLAGRHATVAAVFLDVDGERYLAVTLDGDPAADLQAAHGRYRYFAPDEVQPLPGEAAP